ncbi:hypothetical protein GCM10020331_034710 [Ectobacillus funiculus]
MGELALQNLYGSGVGRVTVMNRTFEKAELMARKYAGQAMPLTDLQRVLEKADILISSTGAAHYVVTKDMMAKVEKQDVAVRFFMVDIAVPRDLDPAISELESAFFYMISMTCRVL